MIMVQDYVLTLSLIPCGSGRRPASKLRMILSTRADSSDDHLPVRHVLLIASLLTAVLFFSGQRAERIEVAGLELDDSMSCSREVYASSNFAAGSGRTDIDVTGARWL